MNFTKSFTTTSFTALILFFVSNSFAQSVQRGQLHSKKVEEIYSPDSTHKPTRAVKYSLIAPGLGQVYNHKLWKVPLIYTGLVMLTKAVVDNQKLYKQFFAFRNVSKRGNLPQKPTDSYYKEYQKYKLIYDRYAVANISEQQLADAASNYQRNFQISILGIFAVWGVQAIDAYIDAKFRSSYTIDNNLSLRLSPALINGSDYATAYSHNVNPGIRLTLNM
jgi:hypothetical protein